MDTREFIFDIPLYCWKQIDADFLNSLIVDQNVENLPRFDGYNPDSGCETTYQLERGFRRTPVLGSNSVMQEIFVLLQLTCTRRGNKMYVLVQTDYEEMKIRKVGQYPSVADIHIAQIKQYSKIIDKADLKDLTRAIGLASNGIGIGSFVYLRRIFENLIFEASKTCIENGLIKQSDFDSARMDEKICMIKTELPDFLYANRKIYGIISKGIHQLAEEECLSMFDIIRSSIEMILDEKLTKFQKEQKQKQLTSQISQLTSKLSDKKA